MRCDIVSSSSKLGNQLKTFLLKVVYQLAQPSGSIASRLGPLDAQGKLLQTMLYLDYTNTDLSIAMSTLESTGKLSLSNYYVGIKLLVRIPILSFIFQLLWYLAMCKIKKESNALALEKNKML